MAEGANLAVVAQKLDDHLLECGRQSKDTNRRLGRIEGVMIAVAASIILQLLAVVGALVAWVVSLASHGAVPHP